MLQVKTFDDVDELNEFLSTMAEEQIKKIDYDVTSDSDEEYSEYFMVVYRV
jgi:hypothetical protein